MPQGSVLGPLLPLLYISDLPGLLKNVLVGYADDSTLFSRIPHPRDVIGPRGMLVNLNKTKGDAYFLLLYG